MSTFLLFNLLCARYDVSASVSWISPDSTLPLSDFAHTVGYYNDSFFLLGGWDHGTKLTEYQQPTDTFILHDTMHGWSLQTRTQQYAQSHDTLYWVRTSYIDQYNMATDTYTGNWQRIPVALRQEACVAFADDHLFISGGYEWVDAQNTWIYHPHLFILNIISNLWIGDNPSLNTERGMHSCAIHNGALWVFGGRTGDGSFWIDTSEKIDIANIADNTWSYTAKLSQELVWTRALAHEGSPFIYIIGGKLWASEMVDIVHMLNTNTEEMTVLDERLVYPICSTAAVLVNNRIYAFSGGYQFYPTDRWMYSTLLQQYSTTNLPQETTTQPSQYPTHDPTTAKQSTSVVSTTTGNAVEPTTITTATSTTMHTASMNEAAPFVSTITMKNEATQMVSTTSSMNEATLFISTTEDIKPIAQSFDDDKWYQSDVLWPILGVCSVVLLIGCGAGVWYKRKKKISKNETGNMQTVIEANANDTQRNNIDGSTNTKQKISQTNTPPEAPSKRDVDTEIEESATSSRDSLYNMEGLEVHHVATVGEGEEGRNDVQGEDNGIALVVSTAGTDGIVVEDNVITTKGAYGIAEEVNVYATAGSTKGYPQQMYMHDV